MKHLPDTAARRMWKEASEEAMIMNRFIAEKVMGKSLKPVTWREWFYHDKEGNKHWTSCGPTPEDKEGGTRAVYHDVPDYSTGKDKADLMDKCVGEEWWEEFEGDAIDKWQNKSPRMFSGHHKLSFTAYLWRNLPELVAEYHGYKEAK